MSLFEIATRKKFRFSTPKGSMGVEDLWDLPLTSTNNPNLDDIARDLHRQLKNDENVSFVVAEQKSDEVIQMKFDLVRHIINVRLTEREQASLAKEKAAKKQVLLGILAERQNEELRTMSKEELAKAISEL